MKIKILLFEPNEILRVTLSEQLLIKKDYDVTLASSLQDFKWHAEKSMFDLLIMGEKEEVYTISSFVEFANAILIERLSFIKRFFSLGKNISPGIVSILCL